MSEGIIKRKMAEKIKALFIYEILGRPAEHIRISLEQLLDQVGENKGIEIINRKVHEPHVIDEEKKKKIGVSEDVFSTFAEVEMEIDGLMLLNTLILNTLPSNVEVIEPNELRIKSFDLSASLSELAIKLHKYDEVAKGMQMEKVQIINIMKEMDEKIRELGGESPVKFGNPDEDNKDEEKGKVDDERKTNDEVKLEDMEGVKVEEDNKSDLEDERK